MSEPEAPSGKWQTRLACAGAGLCIAAAVPPWGWWPLAFVGFALFDYVLAGANGKQRFRRGWMVTAWWLFPAMLWMYDLTAPGYVFSVVVFGLYFGVASLVTPASGTARRIVFPGVFALAELVRWYWPFGGVPLANVALGQVNSPLGQTARLAGATLVISLVVAIGQALNAARRREFVPVAITGGVVAVALAGAALHPKATMEREIDVAVVQGGGPTQTRASSSQEPVVLARHIEATNLIEDPVDLILWPENVVNPGSILDFEAASERVSQVAIDQQATLLAGWFHSAPNGTNTVNYHTSVGPDGTVLDRYDKVQIVPFGEYVPLRSIVEKLNDEIPNRDVIRGTAEPVLDTPLGPVGVAISWEGFFDHRSRHAVREGAQLLTNPTNGATYWLTQIHTQQVASNQLRAIENDRWVLMAGPTGMSAIISPDGTVVQRTGIGERAVLVDTVEMRSGRTLASKVGAWPAIIYGLAAMLFGFRVNRDAARAKAQSPTI